ncbi:MAG: hypothetical protein V3U73_11365 [bacterium]
MDLASIKEWFLGLGQHYGVNPVIFGALYVGAIPFFSASIAWLARNSRRKKSIVVPTLVAGFFFVSAYLYLIFVGNNVPLWVYGFVVAMIVFGAISTAKKVKARVQEGVNEA